MFSNVFPIGMSSNLRVLLNEYNPVNCLNQYIVKNLKTI